ncbi:hypothetical protein ABZ746_28530 [Streptomyces sp. NPDC020096]
MGEVADYLRGRVKETHEALRQAEEGGHERAAVGHRSTLEHLRHLAEDTGADLDAEPEARDGARTIRTEES